MFFFSSSRLASPFLLSYSALPRESPSPGIMASSSLPVSSCRLHQSLKRLSQSSPRSFAALMTIPRGASSNQMSLGKKRAPLTSLFMPGSSHFSGVSLSRSSPVSSCTNLRTQSSSFLSSFSSSSSCSRFFSSSIPPANSAALADPLRPFPSPPASGVFSASSSSSSSTPATATSFYDETILGQLGKDTIKGIHSMDEYELLVYGHPEKVLACLFSARFSLQGKLLLQPFLDLAVSSTSGAASASNVHFLLVDCDEVPRAAYHARVSHPSLACLRLSIDTSKTTQRKNSFLRSLS